MKHRGLKCNERKYFTWRLNREIPFFKYPVQYWHASRDNAKPNRTFHILLLHLLLTTACIHVVALLPSYGASNFLQSPLFIFSSSIRFFEEHPLANPFPHSPLYSTVSSSSHISQNPVSYPSPILYRIEFSSSCLPIPYSMCCQWFPCQKYSSPQILTILFCHLFFPSCAPIFANLPTLTQFPNFPCGQEPEGNLKAPIIDKDYKRKGTEL